MELRNQVEAILFASGKKMLIDDLQSMCKCSQKELINALNALSTDYDARESPMMIFNENQHWKLTVREKYIPLVSSIVAETELTKSTMETLAVIAWKYPIMQSEIVRLRGNKCYEHFKELEDAGFLTKDKSGRSFKIKLTDKFYKYFDLPDNKSIQKAFKNVIPEDIKAKIESTEYAIDHTESNLNELKQIAKDQKKAKKAQAKQTNAESEKLKLEPEIIPENIDDKIEPKDL